jgi:hypothetical protein
MDYVHIRCFFLSSFKYDLPGVYSVFDVALDELLGDLGRKPPVQAPEPLRIIDEPRCMGRSGGKRVAMIDFLHNVHLS